MTLVEKHQEVYRLEEEMKSLKADFEAAKDELAKKLFFARQAVKFEDNGIDQRKVDLAKTIIEVRGTYVRGGDSKASVIADAKRQFIEGILPQSGEHLWKQFFGTKSYEHWHGQRSDHPYGYGPKHGSTIFSVGVRSDIRRDRAPFDLTDAELDAVIYYLTNIERIQAAEKASIAA